MMFLRIISRTPFSVLYAFSDFLFFMSYYVIGYRKKIVRKNLRNSFPEKTIPELKVIEKEFYKNLCDYAVETIKLLTIPAEDLKTRMRYVNPEILEPYIEKKQPVLLLSSHHFNWEWLLAVGGMYLKVPIDFVYQPINNELFDDFIQACRTRFGQYPIKRSDVARELVKRKNEMRGVAVVADQYPGYSKDKKYETKFLNQDTVFFYGAQQMANLVQYPAFYAIVEKVKRGHYTCTLIKIGEPPYHKDSETVVENYARAVEDITRKKPAEWLWSHDRWKTRHLNQQLIDG